WSWLVLLGKRAQRSERRLDESARAPIAGAAALAERGHRDPRQLIQRFPVAVRIEEDLGAADEKLRGDGASRPELLFALAGRVSGRRQRMLDPRRAPVASRFLLRAGGQLRIAGDQVRGGDVAPDLPREDG